MADAVGATTGNRTGECALSAMGGMVTFRDDSTGADTAAQGNTRQRGSDADKTGSASNAATAKTHTRCRVAAEAR